jgi:hypothetical protein
MATKKKSSRGRAAKRDKKPAVAAKKKLAVAPKAKAKKRLAVAKKKATVAPKKKPALAPKKTTKKAALAAKKKATVAPKKKPAVAAKKAVASKSARPKAPAATKRSASTSTPAPKAVAVQRRDGAGHLDAHYAATLREKSQEGRVRDSDEAFIGRSGHSKDNLAEAMGETWVETATSGEDEGEEVFNQAVPEDEGGPFVTTTAGQEFAEGTDASNPERSKREPFPKT